MFCIDEIPKEFYSSIFGLGPEAGAEARRCREAKRDPERALASLALEGDLVLGFCLFGLVLPGHDQPGHALDLLFPESMPVRTQNYVKLRLCLPRGVQLLNVEVAILQISIVIEPFALHNAHPTDPYIPSSFSLK